MIVLLSSAYVVEVRKDKERKGGKVKVFFCRAYTTRIPKKKTSPSLHPSSSSDGCRVADSLSQNSGQQKKTNV